MLMRMTIAIAVIALLVAAGSSIAASPSAGAPGQPSIARGKYLVTIGA
jgi:hypothetical protein